MKRTIYLFSMVFSTLFMSCNIEPLSELPELNPRISQFYIEEIDVPSDEGWVSETLYCYDAPLEGIYAEVDNKTDWISSVCIDETYEMHESSDMFTSTYYRVVVRFFVDKLEGKDWRSGGISFYTNKNDECIGHITITQY